MRKFLAIIVLLCSFAYSRSWIALFGSYDCEECASVKEEWAESFNRTDDPVLIFLPIEHLPNYYLLSRIETALQVKEKANTFPVIMLGRRLMGNVEAFWELEEEFNKLAAEAPHLPETEQFFKLAETATTPVVKLEVKDAPPQKPSEQPATSPQPAAPPRLVFFRQKNCSKCSRQDKELELLKHNLPDVEIAAYDVADLASQAMLTRFHNHFKIPRSKQSIIPLIVWNDGYVTGRLAEAAELQEKLAQAKGDCFWLPPITDDELEAEKKRERSLLDTFVTIEVITSGLMDGINPCAFATSLFLISYLLMRHRRRRDIAAIGCAFCMGVFGAYLLFGLGLSFLIDFLNRFPWVKSSLYILFAVISAVLAVLHLRDALIFRKTGKASDMDMGLSKETHRGIHNKIREFMEHQSWLMVPAAVVLGAVVSSMELACTGQIYLPTLIAINSAGVNAKSFALLLLYNVCFILPLLVVTGFALFGTGLKAVTTWAQNNVFSTKIAMAIIFAVIAVIMIVLVLL